MNRAQARQSLSLRSQQQREVQMNMLFANLLCLHCTEKRSSTSEGTSRILNRLNDIIRSQRLAQQLQSESDSQLASRLEEINLRKQQKLLEEQLQVHRSVTTELQRTNPANQATITSDFALVSQRQPQAPAMPSMQEITKARKILEAARDALTASGHATMNRFQTGQEDLGNTARTMPNTTSAQFSTFSSSLRNSGPVQNTPITSRLEEQNRLLLLSKRALSLATAAHISGQAQSINSGAVSSTTITNQMAHDDTSLVESLLRRQEEERLLTMSKRERPESSSIDDRPTKKWRQSSAADITGPPQTLSSNTDDTNIQGKPQQHRQRRAKIFPVKLMELIERDYSESTVAFLPDGKSFVVLNSERFAQLTSSRNCKYPSLIRKLNRWGFTRITFSGTDCFHHPLFQRGRMDLCAQMTGKNDEDATSVTPRERPSLAGFEKFFAAKAYHSMNNENVHGV